GWTAVQERLAGTGRPPAYQVSALTGKGVPVLSEAIHEQLQQLAIVAREEPVIRTYRLPPSDEKHSIERAGDVLVVRGRDVERILAMADLDSDEGVADLQRQLDKIGVLKELEVAGVAAGDTVRIG